MPTFMLRRKPLLLLATALSFLVFIVFSQQVMADMFSWFEKYDVHLSPAVQGSITFDGKPLFSLPNIEHPDFPLGVASICRWAD